MARSTRLISVLKNQLKQKGVTYKRLADELKLSESAVKQMFASDNMTLKRMDAICEVLAIDISDLVVLAEEQEQKIDTLTLEQERELVDDAGLLLVAYCVVNHWAFEDITRKYRLSETECIQYLARLDKMKLIELLPGNRIRALVANNFTWQRNGPIEEYFRREVQNQFFNSNFDEDGCLRLVKNGDITKQARQQIVERLNAIGRLFDDTTRQERKLPFGERRGSTMVLAIRNWELNAFVALER